MATIDSIIEQSDVSDLLLLANSTRSEYNKLREQTKNRMNRYFYQSIASNYHKEDDIIDGLEKCRDLKEQYRKICDALKKRGLTGSGLE